MRSKLAATLICTALISGCGLQDLDLLPVDLGLDEDTGDNQITAGAKDFVTCNQGQECDYLWGEAIVWLDENARFPVTPKNETTLTAFNPEPDKHRQLMQYRVTNVPHQGGVATLKVEAFCSDTEACKETSVEQVYKVNNYLRNHKQALAEGRIELSDISEPELPRRTEPPARGDLAEISLAHEYQRGRYQHLAKAHLTGEGCLDQSKMTLLKSQPDEDLYEVNCLTGIRYVVFRCTRDGCTAMK